MDRYRDYRKKREQELKQKAKKLPQSESRWLTPGAILAIIWGTTRVWRIEFAKKVA